MQLINTSIPLHHQQLLLNHCVITMQFLLLFLAICQFVQGHAFSLKESCSTEDFHKCGSCTSLGCKIGDNFIGSFTNVTTAEDCKEWCRKRNDYMHDCKYLTYYGKEGVTFQNTCYIFTSCEEKIRCNSCVTETWDCSSPTTTTLTTTPSTSPTSVPPG